MASLPRPRQVRTDCNISSALLTAAPSPTELGTKLVNDGPHKQEPANRRIRGLLGDQWVFDSLDAIYVWEHPYCMSPAKVAL